MLHKKTILVVESDKYRREVYALSLEIEGYSVVLSENVENAVKRISDPTHESFDCVVLDLEESKFCGEMLREAIRVTCEERYGYLPIVLCLPYGVEVGSSLMSFNLYKPFSLELFVETIGNAIFSKNTVRLNQISSHLLNPFF